MHDFELLVPGILLFAYISLLWWLGLKWRNAGLIDFGWPSGFTAIAIYYLLVGNGFWMRKTMIVAMYVVCGLRFVVGWTVRHFRSGEDRRWQLWRERWREGRGMFSIRSIPLNLFAFYHAQTFATLFVLVTPLSVACHDTTPRMRIVEWLAVGFWAISFLLENVADFQLDQFRRLHPNGRGVCRVGLWKYSRHPNYFFEFLIWVAYTVFALPSATGVVDVVVLMLVPVTAYWFLVHFTGIPMTETASRQRRGDAYAQYQAETNRFLPWFPRTRQKEARQ